MERVLPLMAAVSLLLFSLGAVLGKEPPPPKKTPQLVSQGKKLFEQNCVPCHGAKGDGKGVLASTLKPSPSDFALPLKQWPHTKGDPGKVFEVISKGIPNSAMVGWSQLAGKERWGLVYYIMDFAKKK